MVFTRLNILKSHRIVFSLVVGFLLFCPIRRGHAQPLLLTGDPVWRSGRSTFPSPVALGDINGDGSLDVVIGHFGQNVLYLNIAGVFGAEPDWISRETNSTAALALGDVDGDGDLDLVCGNSTTSGEAGEANTLYLNVGGVLDSVPVWRSAIANSTANVKLGDMDGDGDLDLVCGNSTISTSIQNTLYLNIGGPTVFDTIPVWVSPTTRQTTVIELGDVDGDGDLDLVCGNSAQENELYLNVGEPAFFEDQPAWRPTPRNATFGVALGDVDADGDLDLLCGNRSLEAGQEMRLYLNIGGMTVFDTSPAWSSDEATETSDVQLGDIDGDGDLDIVCANNATVNMVYLNRGGVFDGSPTWRSNSTNLSSRVALGDIDGDGDLDVCYGNLNQRTTLFENIAPELGEMPVWSSMVRNTKSVALGDMDGDGDLDLVCGNFGNGNTIYLNNGGGFADVPCEWSHGDDTYAIALGDIDGDGNIDIVSGNFGQPNTVHSGACDAVLMWSAPTPYYTQAVVLGDVDGKNGLDLVCGNAGQANMLYINNGGTLDSLAAWVSKPTNSTTSMALADVDSDGDVDLVCGNAGQPNTLYLNVDGVFDTIPAWESDASLATFSVDVADVDGDGDLDIVFGNSGQRNSLYKNDGTNTGRIFESTPGWMSGPQNLTTSVSLEDIDGDGDVDLVCGNNGPNAVYRNDGGMLRTEPEPHAGSTGPTEDLVLGDVDYDGDVDLVCGDSGPNTLFLNGKNPTFQGDPAAPRNQLPNNASFLRDATVVEAGRNLYRIAFTAVDVESDPVWIVPDYQLEGSATWVPLDIVGHTSRVGPFATSPGGVRDSLDWDISAMPFDERDIVLRLRATPYRQASGTMRHSAPYRKRLGRVIPARPEITTPADTLSLPTANVGDSVSTSVVIANTGSEDLVIDAIRLDPSAEMWVDVSTPVVVSPGTQIDVEVFFGPSRDGSVSQTLTIISNDWIAPVHTVTLRARARPLSFFLANLNPGGIIEMGEDLIVSIRMEDSVRVDSARVLYRNGGEDTFRPLRLERIEETAAEEYFGVVDGRTITSRGVEYFVEVHNGPALANSPQRRLRVEVAGLSFPSPQPALSYRMISIPLELVGGEIVGILEDDLGGRDVSKWRMFTYRAGNYEEVPNGDIVRFSTGRAFWLVVRNATTLTTAPVEGLSTPTDGAFGIALAPGWNMIANPFNFLVAWNSVRADSVTMDAIAGAGVQGPLWWQGEGGYVTVDMLKPFEGYWVLNPDSVPLVLRIPPIEADSSLIADSRAADLPHGNETDDTWRIDIGASSRGAADLMNMVGAGPGASLEWDPYDRLEPPMSPGPSISLYFPHRAWKVRPGNYTVDIRENRGSQRAETLGLTVEDGAFEGHVWFFDVAKNYVETLPGDEVVLEFGGIERIDDEAGVYFVDRQLGRQLDLRRANKYTFYQAKNDGVTDENDARFVLLVGNEEFIDANGHLLPQRPANTALHGNFPNPFNPRTIIRYELAEPGPISLRIYDVSGALVRVLEEADRESGRYEVGWSGDNGRGGKVASGVYFIRLTAPGFTQTRKMILLK